MHYIIKKGNWESEGVMQHFFFYLCMYASSIQKVVLHDIVYYEHQNQS